MTRTYYDFSTPPGTLSTADGHGGHGAEHRREMWDVATTAVQRIAPTVFFREVQKELPAMVENIVTQVVPPLVEKIITETVPPLAADIYNDALKRLVGAWEYDVNSVVSVQMAHIGEVYHSEKFRKIVSEQIMKELRARIKGLEI